MTYLTKTRAQYWLYGLYCVGLDWYDHAKSIGLAPVTISNILYGESRTVRDTTYHKIVEFAYAQGFPYAGGLGIVVHDILQSNPRYISLCRTDQMRCPVLVSYYTRQDNKTCWVMSTRRRFLPSLLPDDTGVVGDVTLPIYVAADTPQPTFVQGQLHIDMQTDQVSLDIPAGLDTLFRYGYSRELLGSWLSNAHRKWCGHNTLRGDHA